MKIRNYGITLMIVFSLVLVSGIAGCSGKEKSISECDKMVESNIRDLCYNYAAQEFEDILVCGKIESPSNVDLCYSNIATIENDSSICNKILDETYKMDCVDSLSGKQDFSLSEENEPGSLPKIV